MDPYRNAALSFCGQHQYGIHDADRSVCDRDKTGEYYPHGLVGGIHFQGRGCGKAPFRIFANGHRRRPDCPVQLTAKSLLFKERDILKLPDIKDAPVGNSQARDYGEGEEREIHERVGNRPQPGRGGFKGFLL